MSARCRKHSLREPSRSRANGSFAVVTARRTLLLAPLLADQLPLPLGQPFEALWIGGWAIDARSLRSAIAAGIELIHGGIIGFEGVIVVRRMLQIRLV